LARISIERLRDGLLPKEETYVPKVTEAAGKLVNAPIYIDETPSLRIFDFKARSRYAVVNLGVKLIVIDYVQLMTTGGKAAASPYERSIELSKISMTIKEVARELNVPIIAIAQLNREPEKSPSGKPRMSNLRECGQFEQDADLVGLIWREEYYVDDEEAKREVAGEAELIVAKHKDGPVGSIKLTFLKEFTRFENRTKALLSNNEEERQQA
jgi:replicative DNA helicase